MKNSYSIRLKRFGRSDLQVYYITVSFKKYHVSSKYFEKLGFLSFLPNSEYRVFFINLERLGFWLLRGGVVSKRLALLLGKLCGGAVNFELIKVWNKRIYGRR